VCCGTSTEGIPLCQPYHSCRHLFHKAGLHQTIWPDSLTSATVRTTTALLLPAQRLILARSTHSSPYHEIFDNRLTALLPYPFTTLPPYHHEIFVTALDANWVLRSFLMNLHRHSIQRSMLRCSFGICGCICKDVVWRLATQPLVIRYLCSQIGVVMAFWGSLGGGPAKVHCGVWCAAFPLLDLVAPAIGTFVFNGVERRHIMRSDHRQQAFVQANRSEGLLCTLHELGLVG